MSTRSSRVRVRAFTLVELLVVIGIIALLIAILLPVLGKARAQGQWAVCLSNMRQLSQAMIDYSQQNKNFYPRPASGGNGNFSDDWIHWQDTASGYSGPAVDLNQSALAPYLGFPFPAFNADSKARNQKLVQMLRCPGDDAEQHIARSGIGRYMYSYTLNDRVNRSDDDSAEIRRKYSQVKNSSAKILFAEEKNPNDGRFIPTNAVVNSNPDQSTGDDILALRHQKQGNIAFFDGHVERLTQGEANVDPKRYHPFQN